MDLFVVNRYPGPDAPVVDAPDESELRESLMRKVKERRKLKSKQHANDDGKVTLNDCNEMEAEEFENVSNIKVKVKRKREAESHETFDSDVVEVPSEKKKKKKKKSRINSDEVMTSPDITNNMCNNVEYDEGGGGDDDDDDDEDLSKGESATVQPFSILGSDSFSKPTKVKRCIPQWLANPSVVSVDLKKLDAPVDSIAGLEKIFVDKLKKNNITHFFPVQRQIIPWLIENMRKPSFYWPNDICVSAPTGSGKTLAFVLPILQALRTRITPQIRALIVLPAQDLASQVYKVFDTYGKATDLKIVLLSKKRPFPDEQNLICKKDELKGYTTLVDVVVTTAGRLVDHLTSTTGLNLSHLKYLVIDEADRVMEDMQNDWLYHLNKKILSDSSKSYQTPVLTYNTLSTKRKLPQKLLFSATLSQDPEKLQQLGLFQPKLFTSVVADDRVSAETDQTVSVGRFIGKYTTPAELQEYYMVSMKSSKPLAVHHLLSSESWRSVLCFVNSVQATARLSFLLRRMNQGLRIASISAKLSPAERSKLIDKFSNGQIDVLISSDALARGIDIPNVKHVISYDLPKYLKTYIHRIGRTGRAGKAGVSLILLTESEVPAFTGMIRDAGKRLATEMKVDDEALEAYTTAYEEALRKLDARLRREKEQMVSAIKSAKRKNRRRTKTG